jgi:hypothetical protein
MLKCRGICRFNPTFFRWERRADRVAAWGGARFLWISSLHHSVAACQSCFRSLHEFSAASYCLSRGCVQTTAGRSTRRDNLEAAGPTTAVGVAAGEAGFRSASFFVAGEGCAGAKTITRRTSRVLGQTPGCLRPSVVDDTSRTGLQSQSRKTAALWLGSLFGGLMGLRMVGDGESWTHGPGRAPAFSDPPPRRGGAGPHVSLR